MLGRWSLGIQKSILLRRKNCLVSLSRQGVPKWTQRAPDIEALVRGVSLTLVQCSLWRRCRIQIGKIAQSIQELFATGPTYVLASIP